ncbi:MAG: hypothetical protein LBC51_01650 [Treponema sp.]|nr:hypothetical protein [Treponema sp.]
MVTRGTLGRQTALAETIREKPRDYPLAVKENQPRLIKDIWDYVEYLDEEPCRERAADQGTGE